MNRWTIVALLGFVLVAYLETTIENLKGRVYVLESRLDALLNPHYDPIEGQPKRK